jgi:hypothetical protein
MPERVTLVIKTDNGNKIFDAEGSELACDAFRRVTDILVNGNRGAQLRPQVGRHYSMSYLNGNLRRLIGSGSNTLFLTLWHPLRGGKGGFGQTLKGQGKRMNKKAGSEESKDNYRLLDGRRVKVVRKARELAALVETADAKKKEARQKKKEKLLAAIEAANRSSSSNIRFTDTEMLEKSEELVNEIRDSVSRAVAKPKTSKASNSDVGEPKRARGAKFFGDEDTEASDTDDNDNND